MLQVLHDAQEGVMRKEKEGESHQAQHDEEKERLEEVSRA